MNWWLGSQSAAITARLARPADRPALSALLAGTWRRFGALAVEDQAALINSGLSALAFAGHAAVGFLGLLARTPTGEPLELWVDATLVAVAADQPASRVARVLLDAALPTLRALHATGIVCLTGESWLQRALMAIGFEAVDAVLSYARDTHSPLPGATSVAALRTAVPADTAVVLDLNAVAFTPFWRYDCTTVLSWLITADHAVVAEKNGQAVGFALTTFSQAGDPAYLVRVAVHPDFQGQGIGRQLVVDALSYVRDAGSTGLALNTQASNVVARRLYESLGFRPSGAAAAVLCYRLAAG